MLTPNPFIFLLVIVLHFLMVAFTCDFEKRYEGELITLCFPPCQFVYTKQAGRKPTLQQNWQSSEKSQDFEEKTQYLLNTLYLLESIKIQFSEAGNLELIISRKCADLSTNICK